MEEEPIRSFEFGEWRLDSREKFLWFKKAPVDLPPKAIELLCALVEKNGEVLTKGEIFERIWKGSFVEETNLPHHIYLLRKAFKDNSEDNLIQTVSRRGYRFTGDARAILRDSGTVVFERRSVTRTLIEKEAEVDDKALMNPKRLGPFSRPGISLMIALVAVVLVVSAFSVWRFSSGTAADVSRIDSLAVLPLKELNKGTGDGSFSLGLTDSLISGLGRLNRFAVRPYTSVEKYVDSKEGALVAGKELAVDAVLEGTVQHSGDRVRISLRLIRMRSGEQLWSDTFDGKDTDLLDLQISIAHKVSRVILQDLTLEELQLLAKRPTKSPEAYALYLAGRERWLRRDWKADSLIFYRKAIEIDPDFALAYLGIADQKAFSADAKDARTALAKAIEIDPELHEALATRGFIQMFHDWDWEAAERSLMSAIEMAPNSPKAHHWYGVLLSLQGRFDEAMKEMETASKLDPTALIIRTDIAELYYFKREYSRAAEELEKINKTDPDFVTARANLVKVRYMQGASFVLESASFLVDDAKRIRGAGVDQAPNVERMEALWLSGDEEGLRTHFLEMMERDRKENSRVNLALSHLYLALGNKEGALKVLEDAYDGRVFLLPFIAVDPVYDDIRQEPAFLRVVDRMGLSRKTRKAA